MPTEKFQKIQAYRTFIEALKRAFNNIEQNNCLEKTNINKIYAVDFSELFEYCIPSAKSLSASYKLPNDRRQISKYRDKIALWLIFNYYKDLTILPPHRLELYRYVRAIREDSRIANANIEYEIQSIRKNILNDSII